MCDTFRPMFPTKAAMEFDDLAYPRSWEGEHFPVSLGHDPSSVTVNGASTGASSAKARASSKAAPARSASGNAKKAGKAKASSRRSGPLASTWE